MGESDISLVVKSGWVKGVRIVILAVGSFSVNVS